jgi:hypothetical protein
LQKSPTYKRLSFKNSYLLILAAWLLTFSVIIETYWSGNASLKAVHKQVEQHIQTQEKDFENLLKDTALTRQIDDKSFGEPSLLLLAQKPYFVFRYFVNDIGLHRLLFWNTQTVLPTEEIINTTDSTGFVKLGNGKGNGYYVWNKKNTATSLTIALIPVKWNYFVENNYLQNNFVAEKGGERNFDIADKPAGASVKSIAGNTLFFLAEKPGQSIPKNNIIAIWFRILAAILVLLFIHLLAIRIAAARGLSKALLFLLPLVLALRIVSYYLPIPLNFRQFEMFDPSIYGSNIVLRSLGDLLINALLFTWIVVFIHNQLYQKQAGKIYSNKWFKWVLLAVVTIILLTITFTAGHIISSMVADSQLSFDVINFFTLNIYSVTGFIVLCCMAIGYFLLSQILLQFIQPYFSKNFAGLYLVIAVSGLIYLSIRLSISHAGFELAILAWLMLYVLLLNRAFLALSFKKISSTGLIFWLFFFSLTITAVIVLENSQKEINNRKHYAETLATKADPASETLLNTLLTDFRSEYLAANFYRFENEISNHFLQAIPINMILRYLHLMQMKTRFLIKKTAVSMN